ncbi:MAG: DNA mismatch repair protein MutS [Bacteroidales bacterium]|jgi:DNA mismatch repair protein MutS|nr:DNA mismatch repair protein MutS [Bacteroidales bacterium]
MPKDSQTPMMKQYNEIKAKYPDTILLYRIGDFYETFGEDAVVTSKILGIVLTKRSGGEKDSLAGFPYHALDTYLPKFLKAGKRVAICEQVEDPKLAKGIVKREITEVVTPSISYNDNAIDGSQNNYLVAIHKDKEEYGVAFIDITTGEFLVSQGKRDDVDKLIQNFAPKEAVIQRKYERDFENVYKDEILIKTYDDWVFTSSFANDTLNSVFNVNSLKGFGIEDYSLAIIAAGAAIYYIQETNHTELSHICNISRIDNSKYVWLDKFTIRNLELISSVNGKETTLYNVINKTQSNMGARMLQRWILLPLKNKEEIEKRQNIVTILLYNDEVSESIKGHIKEIGDMERVISKLSFRRIQPNELFNIINILKQVKSLKQDILKLKNNTSCFPILDSCDELVEFLSNTINEDAPNNISKGNAIKQGYDEQLDYYRNLAYNSQSILDDIQKNETEKTGISSLKIGFNNVFGYYLEVTNTHKDKVPESWTRKQTLANAERYITPELKEIETRILSSQEKISEIETKIYQQVIENSLPFIQRLQTTANSIAEIDCLLSFAIDANDNNYTKPTILTTDILHINKGRHPVIEKMLPIGEEYIANDVYLDTTTQQIMIITGPNMSGKSAYLRQTALIVILAQIGSYVPAKTAEIGIVDKIFTRVGASDNISSGESTFMVEMNETASILNNLSSHSLILLDEIGRGTSTYDGVSIAWAIAAFLHDNKYKAKVLFATHYHELISMEKQFDRIKNYHITVKEIGSKIIFLRIIAKGGSSQSFGIHVARLAGVPKEVLRIADKILDNLESSHSKNNQLSLIEEENGDKKANKTIKERQKEEKQVIQTSFIQLNDPILLQIKDDILKIDIENITPVEALNKLNNIKKLVENI